MMEAIHLAWAPKCTYSECSLTRMVVLRSLGKWPPFCWGGEAPKTVLSGNKTKQKYCSSEILQELAQRYALILQGMLG